MVRLMTWSVWWRFGTDWRRRGDAIEATIPACEPDLVGLQEAWATGGTEHAAELATVLGMHSAFGRGSLPPAPDPVEHAESRVHGLPAAHHALPVALEPEVAHPLGRLRVLVTTTEWEPEFRDDHIA